MGTIEILAAQENRALGRLTDAARFGPPLTGDLVASKVIDKPDDTRPQLTPSQTNSLFKERSWDFGTVPRGEKVTHSFIVTNTLKDPIHIDRVRTGAAFVTHRMEVEWEYGPLEHTWLTPGQSAKLSVKV